MKRPFSILSLSFAFVLTALFLGIWGILDKTNIVLLAIAFICLLTSVGIFFMKNWARILAFILAFGFIVVGYIPLVVLALVGILMNWPQSYIPFIAAIVLAPALIACLMLIKALNRDQVKNLFHYQ